jgi:hypothetical protein
LFPGGTLRSFSDVAAFSASSFRRATGQRFRGIDLAAFDSTPLKRSSVALLSKLLITSYVMTGTG